MAKETVKVNVQSEQPKQTGLTLRQRFESLGLNLDSLTIRFEGFVKSGNWYTLVGNVLTGANKFEQFVCKLNAGDTNADYIKEVEQFFADFKEGDYVIQGAQLRVKGEDWHDDESGKSGVYEQSYVSIPFASSMLYLGTDTVYNLRKQESNYAKMALSNLKLVEE